jgi:hypothetical protein
MPLLAILFKVVGAGAFFGFYAKSILRDINKKTVFYSHFFVFLSI